MMAMLGPEGPGLVFLTGTGLGCTPGPGEPAVLLLPGSGDGGLRL